MNMKTRSFGLGCAAACFALSMALPVGRAAAIDEQQFNELKDLVNKQGQKIDKQDQRIIRKMDQKLSETQRTVSYVQQTAAMAAPVEPLPRVPLDEATVNHNFSILGDAEVQFAKTSGQHAAFLFADFAPIFLYRGGESVLFEAGFDFALQNGQNAGPTHDASSTTTI